MSAILRKSWVVALGVLAGSALLTSVAFSATTSPACDNDYRVDEIDRINFEADVVPTGGVEYEITALIAGDCEVDYSVTGSSLEDVMNSSIEELNESSITFNRTITREDLSNKIYGTDGNLVRYFADYSDLSFEDITEITIQPADKTGSVSAYIDFEGESYPLVITLSYSAYPSLSSFISEVDSQLRTEYQLGGSFDEDDLLAIADIDIDFYEYGKQLEKLVADYAQSELCEEFTPSDIYEVTVEGFNWYEDESQKDKVTVKWSGGCDYYFKTNARAGVADFWKGYLVQEIVEKINNTQYRISPAVEYDDIADVIVFKGNYPTDAVPSLAQLQAEKDGQVATTEQDADVSALRAKLMQLIEMLRQLLQLQSSLGR